MKALKTDCGEKIIRIMSRLSRPVDAMDLVDRIKVNKTTVYRQLDKLINKGLLIEVEFGDGKKRYELKSLGHHHHIVCKKCGSLKDIEIDEEKLLSGVYGTSDFVVESHNLEFFGYCKKCK